MRAKTHDSNPVRLLNGFFFRGPGPAPTDSTGLAGPTLMTNPAQNQKLFFFFFRERESETKILIYDFSTQNHKHKHKSKHNQSITNINTEITNTYFRSTIFLPKSQTKHKFQIYDFHFSLSEIINTNTNSHD